MAEPNIADLARTLDRLVERLDKTNGQCPFTDEEIAQIKRGAQLVEWFDTAGWIGKRLMTLTAAFVLLLSYRETIMEWIRTWK